MPCSVQSTNKHCKLDTQTTDSGYHLMMNMEIYRFLFTDVSVQFLFVVLCLSNVVV